MLLADPLQELGGEEVVAYVGRAEGELAAALNLSSLGDLLRYLGVLDHLDAVVDLANDPNRLIWEGLLDNLWRISIEELKCQLTFQKSF